MPASGRRCIRKYTGADGESRLHTASPSAGDISIATDVHADIRQPHDSTAHLQPSQMLRGAQQLRRLDGLHPRLRGWQSRRAYFRATIRNGRFSTLDRTRNKNVFHIYATDELHRMCRYAWEISKTYRQVI